MDSSILVIKLKDLGTAGSVRMAVYESIHNSFVAQFLGLDHCKSAERIKIGIIHIEADSVMVIIGGDAFNAVTLS